MSKIAINLLPPEYVSERLKDARFYKIQAIGVAMILLLIFFSSLAVALRILQSQRLKQTEMRLNDTQQRVVALRDRQATLMALKNRLTAINQYVGVSSVQSQLLGLYSDLLPASIAVGTLNIDQSGEISFTAVVPDSYTLDLMLKDFLDKDKNQNKFNSISVENLNRGRDGIYRLSIKIQPKKT